MVTWRYFATGSKWDEECIVARGHQPDVLCLLTLHEGGWATSVTNGPHALGAPCFS